MENSQPSFMDLLLEAHRGLERQGPGSPEATRQALVFLGPLERFARVAVLGCGTGGQTLLLAESLPGSITALGMFPDFIGRLAKRAAGRECAGRIAGIVGDMAHLPFQQESLDLIWSEGAIDAIGFENGLRHWHAFLKQDGYVAVTCPSWITEEHPAAVDQFWSGAGVHLHTVAENIESMRHAGYAFIAAFVLPETCWTDNYFTPRASAIQDLANRYAHSDVMREYAAINQQEVALFLKYRQHYGYVFYIGRAI